MTDYSDPKFAPVLATISDWNWDEIIEFTHIDGTECYAYREDARMVAVLGFNPRSRCWSPPIELPYTGPMQKPELPLAFAAGFCDMRRPETITPAPGRLVTQTLSAEETAALIENSRPGPCPMSVGMEPIRFVLDKTKYSLRFEHETPDKVTVVIERK